MRAAWIFAFAVTILGSAAAALLLPYAGGVDLGLWKSRSAKPKREAKPEPAAPVAQPKRAEKEKKKAVIQRLVSEGEKAEDREEWELAAAKYREAVQLRQDDGLAKRLTAIALVQEAIASVKAGRLPAAHAKFRECLPHIDNKTFVVRRVTAIKDYQSHCKQGRAKLKAGQIDEAAKLLRKATMLADEEGYPNGAVKKLWTQAEARLAKRRDRARAIQRILDAAEGRRDFLVVIALCNNYQRDASCHKLHAELAAREKRASAAVASHPEAFPITRMDETLRLQTVHLKGGRTLPVIGRIIEEEDLAIRVELPTKDKKIIRLILRTKIDRIDGETDIRALNNEKAIGLLNRAKETLRQKRSYDCLRLLGQLYAEFADLPMMRGNGPLALASQAAAMVERICPKCLATGKETCPTCKGTKRKNGECCWDCRGTGMVRCDMCDGSGQMPGTGTVAAATKEEKKGQKGVAQRKSGSQAGPAREKTTERVILGKDEQ